MRLSRRKAFRCVVAASALCFHVLRVPAFAYSWDLRSARALLVVNAGPVPLVRTRHASVRAVRADGRVRRVAALAGSERGRASSARRARREPAAPARARGRQAHRGAATHHLPRHRTDRSRPRL